MFPPWGTALFRSVLGLVAAAIASIPAALWAWERTPYVTGTGTPRAQPVKFDHRHHVRDDGIACGYCHTDFARSSSAGMPAISVCMGCHSQIWSDSPELAPIRAGFFSDVPLAWERVTRLPQFVFFDHSIHVKKGVGCVSCHGRVDLMAGVYAVQPFTMRFCLDCHRSPKERLRPPSEVTNMEWVDATGTAAAAQLVAGNVSPGTDCTTCHR